MSEEGQDLIAQLERLQANLQVMLDKPLAGLPSRHPRLKATPEGMQVLRDTIERLLSTGELWWETRD